MVWNGLKMTRNIRSGLENLLLHKLRSFLTMLGVVFGVGSVVAMLSVGEGAGREALEQIHKLGSNNIMVSSIKPVEEQSTSANRSLRFALGVLDRVPVPPSTRRMSPKTQSPAARRGDRGLLWGMRVSAAVTQPARR